VHLVEGGVFHHLLKATEVMTNTLHGQGICKPAPRVIVEGRTDDGTPEAVRVEGAAGFALAVQWHPEWNAAEDPVSRALFGAFGAAAAGWAGAKRAPGGAKSG
jgi:putative glutamine amidotransferase